MQRSPLDHLIACHCNGAPAPPTPCSETKPALAIRTSQSAATHLHPATLGGVHMWGVQLRTKRHCWVASPPKHWRTGSSMHGCEVPPSSIQIQTLLTSILPSFFFFLRERQRPPTFATSQCTAPPSQFTRQPRAVQTMRARSNPALRQLVFMLQTPYIKSRWPKTSNQ